MHASLYFIALLVASASAVYTPHHLSRHAAIARHAARAPIPVAEPLSNNSSTRVRAKRQSGKCKAKPASVSPSSSASASSTPTPPFSPVPPPANPGSDPKTTAEVPTSSHSPSSSSTHSVPPATPSPPPHTQAPPPTHAPAPTTSAQPPSNTGSSGGGGGGATPFGSFFSGQQSGDGTFYATGLGACGITNQDSDFIVAVSHLLWNAVPGFEGGNPNNNPVCNKQITATYQGKSVTVTVTDECMGCDATSLDFSPSAFQVLAPESVGRLHGVTWEWS